MTTDLSGFVMISVERYKLLEKVEQEKKQRLANLHEHDRQRHRASGPRVQKYLEKNREAYNARRRELRKLKKEGADNGAPATPPADPDTAADNGGPANPKN
jgi:DNA repair exonuclease SbcCD ATPase subunit